MNRTTESQANAALCAAAATRATERARWAAVLARPSTPRPVRRSFLARLLGL